MTPALFLALVAWSCCLLTDPLLSLGSIYQDVLRFSSLPQDMRNKELLTTLNSVYSRGDGTNNTASFSGLNIQGWSVCEDCYRSTYGLSIATWNRRKQEVKEGKHDWEHGNTGNEGNYTAKGYQSRAWMSKYFCELGDFQPDTGQVHLPPMDKKDIHGELRQELGDDAVSLPHFYTIWGEDFEEYTIPPEQRLGKCKECAELHENIMDCKDARQRQDLKRLRRTHIRFVRQERLVYHKWRRECQLYPDKYMMIILDGMDQSKTNVPSFNCGDQPQQVTVRIVGAIVHGRTKQSYAYAITHFTKETNSMIEVLSRVLADQETLPPNIIIQLDNTCTDNKNVKLFSYLGSLVETEIFESVTVNFLPVGHTHVRL